MTIIEKIRDLVAEGETERSIDELFSYIKSQDSEVIDRIILLKSRMHDLKDAISNGTINDNEASIQRAKINEAILRVLHDITPTYLEPKPKTGTTPAYTPPAIPTSKKKNRTTFIVIGALLILVLGYFALKDTAEATTPEVVLELPEFKHNVVYNSDYWMEIRVPGSITGAKGSKCQVVARFMANGQFIPARADEISYRDGFGNVASGTEPFTIPTDNYFLGENIIRIPYRSFNLPNTGGQTTHTLHLYAEVFLNDQSVKMTPSQMFNVTW